MKMNTMLRYNFTADIYVPRIAAGSGGNTVYALYPENQAVPVRIVSSRTQSTMFTEGPVEFGARVLQVRNPAGKMLFIEDSADGPEEYAMHVHAVLPVVDVYGTITGYRSVLREPQPVLDNVKPSSDSG